MISYRHFMAIRVHLYTYIYIYTHRGRSVGSVQLLNVFTKKINKSMSRSK
jgi:hypothetical protein